MHKDSEWFNLEVGIISYICDKCSISTEKYNTKIDSTSLKVGKRMNTSRSLG